MQNPYSTIPTKNTNKLNLQTANTKKRGRLVTITATAYQQITDNHEHKTYCLNRSWNVRNARQTRCPTERHIHLSEMLSRKPKAVLPELLFQNNTSVLSCRRFFKCGLSVHHFRHRKGAKTCLRSPANLFRPGGCYPALQKEKKTSNIVDGSRAAPITLVSTTLRKSRLLELSLAFAVRQHGLPHQEEKRRADSVERPDRPE